MSRPLWSEGVSNRTQDWTAPYVSRSWAEPSLPGTDVARYPSAALTGSKGAPRLPQLPGMGFDAVHRAEALTSPADANGGVSASQILVCVSGRIRVFDKSGTLGDLDTSTDAFFSSVRNGAATRYPRVRFDILTNRWFILMTTVEAQSNRILLAVSDGPTINLSTVFTFFSFRPEDVGTQPNFDSGRVADSVSMGVDNLALYLGSNVFNGVNFVGTCAYVVKKSSVMGTGPIEVSAFRNLTGTPTGRGLYAPQGVDNPDAASTEGYFVGVDNGALGRVVVRRVTDPGGIPSLSANLNIIVPSTSLPMHVPALGSLNRLNGIDDRLSSARIYRNLLNGTRTLWTCQSIQVNASGVASNGGGRNGVRWYQLDNLTTTPVVIQSGTIFDPAASNPASYWVPSCVSTGQGHLAVAFSQAGNAIGAGAGSSGRFRFDPQGSSQGVTNLVSAGGTYNVDTFSPQRWGVYSQSVVDPSDAMTTWTFQQYCDANDSWGVRVVQLKAPAPPELTLVPSGVLRGDSVQIGVSGTFANGSEFFDPGPDYANRLQVAIEGEPGITISSWQLVTPTQIQVNVDTDAQAPAGTRVLRITNPDGQTVTANFDLRNPTPELYLMSPISRPTGNSATTVTLTGANFLPSSQAKVNGVLKESTVVSDTEITFVMTEQDLSVGATLPVVVFTPGPGGGDSNALTFTVVNPAPVINAINPTSTLVNSSDTTVTVDGSSFVPNTVIRLNDVDLATTYVSPSQVTCVIPASMLQTARNVRLKAFNPTPAGGLSAEVVFTVANPAPSITDFSPSQMPVNGGDFTLTVDGANFVPSSFIRFAGIDRATTYVSSTQLTAVIPGSELQVAGTRTVRVVTPDPGGGIAGPLTFYVTNPTPTLTEISPSQVFAGSSSFTLTVTGTNFVAGSFIRWNGLDRPTTYISDTTLTCNVPIFFLTNPGYANITVWNPGPGGGETAPLTFSIVAPPAVLTSLAPDHVTQFSSDTAVTINGSGFYNGCVARLDGVDLPTTFVSTTRITALVPASAMLDGGTRSMTVMNPAPSTESNSLTLFVDFADPVLDTVSPETIPTGSPDTEITLTGDHFASNSYAVLDGVQLSSTWVSRTELHAIVPASMLTLGKTSELYVQTPAPGGGTSGSLLLTIQNPVPTLDAISPNVVTAGGPTFTLVVTGTNFVPNSQVTLNQLPRQTTYVSPTELRATILDTDIRSGGAAAIRVKSPTPGGGTTPFLELRFMNPAPTLDAIAPSYRAAGSGSFVLTVTGTNFVGNSYVTWKGSARPTTYVSGTQLQATISATDIASPGTATVRVVNPAPNGGVTDFKLFAIGPSNSVMVLPDLIELIQGEIQDDTLANLFESDNTYVGLFNDSVTLTAQIVVSGHMPSFTASAMRLEYETSVGRAGLIQQVHLYNWFGNRWQIFQGSTAPTSDTFLQLDIPSAGQFVRSSDGLIQFRATWLPINDEAPAQDGWLHSLDVVRWQVAP